MIYLSKMVIFQFATFNNQTVLPMSISRMFSQRLHPGSTNEVFFPRPPLRRGAVMTPKAFVATWAKFSREAFQPWFFWRCGPVFFVFSASRSQPKRNIGWVNWDVSSLASSTISGFRGHGLGGHLRSPWSRYLQIAFTPEKREHGSKPWYPWWIERWLVNGCSSQQKNWFNNV